MPYLGIQGVRDLAQMGSRSDPKYGPKGVKYGPFGTHYGSDLDPHLSGQTPIYALFGHAGCPDGVQI